MELQEKAAKEVDMQPGITVTFPKIVIVKTPKQTKIDFSGYRINELRSMAANRNIKGSFTMKKVDLIKLLKKTEDKNGTKNR